MVCRSGVYTLLHEEQRPWKSSGSDSEKADDKSLLRWKHATEDLVICQSKSSSEQ